jgi:hypothetical protein
VNDFDSKYRTEFKGSEMWRELECGCKKLYFISHWILKTRCERHQTIADKIEHDQELIREGRAMSDRDTRRGE